MANHNLSSAKRAKNDEFYTQFIDIQREIEAYLDYDPKTFKGMGVPISFLDKYNPEQFEIIGCSYSYGEPIGYHIKNTSYGVSVSKRDIYKRIFIKHKGI